jgi:thymidylate kinase
MRSVLPASIMSNVLEKQFLVPDLTIIFDLPVDVALSRIKHVRGDIPYEFEKAEPY